MQLTEEQIAAFRERLAGKLKACPMCGTAEWAIEKEVVTLAGTNVGADGFPDGMDARRMLPLILIGCSNCGLNLMYPWTHVFGRPHGR